MFAIRLFFASLAPYSWLYSWKNGSYFRVIHHCNRHPFPGTASRREQCDVFARGISRSVLVFLSTPLTGRKGLVFKFTRTRVRLQGRRNFRSLMIVYKITLFLSLIESIGVLERSGYQPHLVPKTMFENASMICFDGLYLVKNTDS